MNKENIQMLLETVCQYHSVQITQTFSREEIDWIRVKCLPGTQILELTYLQTETVECYESIKEAADAIFIAIDPTRTP